MKLIPVFKCSNMKSSLDFYTGILGFEIKYPGTTADEPFVTIQNGEAEIQLAVIDGSISTVNVRIDNPDALDALFSQFISRGLDTSGKENSPVHQGPLNQTWGMREFYVTDADGNTLRFGCPVK